MPQPCPPRQHFNASSSGVFPIASNHHSSRAPLELFTRPVLHERLTILKVWVGCHKIMSQNVSSCQTAKKPRRGAGTTAAGGGEKDPCPLAAPCLSVITYLH